MLLSVNSCLIFVVLKYNLMVVIKTLDNTAFSNYYYDAATTH